MADRLKDQFFTPESLRALAERIAQVYPVFNVETFLNLIYEGGWEGMELKERMHHTARCLGRMLPPAYPEALAILKEAALAVRGFEAMVLPDFVEMYGQDDWDLSMPALAYFTQFGSSEFAVRPFLDRDPERGMAYMLKWAQDENPHVRRLASEGCRPRLPWAMALPKFKADPRPILPVLELLKEDVSESVRNSVANNLNDIAKDHPDLVLDICERWYGHSVRTDWIVKKACRTLLKSGNVRALRLFGFGDPGHVEVERLTIDNQRVPIGGTVSFSFDMRIEAEAETRVRLEYAIWFVKARGTASKKVFQWSERTYKPGLYVMQKTHAMGNLTTRKHYPGKHRLAIIVNGEEKAAIDFELIDEVRDGIS